MSRIRTNLITNRMANGAPTVSNGLVISGVTTVTTLDLNGDLDVDGHTNLDNVNIAGVTTSTGNIYADNYFGNGGITLNNNGNPSVNLTSTSTTGSSRINFGDPDSSSFGKIYYIHDGDYFKFDTAGSEKLRIDSVGSIGQGTGTPRTPDGSNADNPLNGDGTNGNPVFTIYGDSPAINLVSSTTASGDYSLINFGRTGSSSNPYRAAIGYKQSDDILRINAQNEIAFDTDGNINTGERLRIKSNGCIGINTTSPENNSNDVSLHIHGSANDDCRIAFSTPTKSNPGSRIGYFGLNRFGIDTYDGLEVRDVTASYATRFKIDQNGYMTNNQPYGYVRFNTIADTGGENRQTNVNTHTVANGMSHSGGRLTVPTAGMYYIGIKGNIYDNNSAAQYLFINGSKTDGFRWQQSDSTAYWKSSMVSGIISLSANDYLDVYVTGQQDNASWNMFTVYMLG